MSVQPSSDAPGPIEAETWPERLTARVVTPGDDPRIHGYSIESDLARHYRTTDAILLALTGELPSEVDGAVFEIAMHFLSATTIAEAPAHAAALARLCAATPSAVVGSAAICAAEQSRFLLDTHDAWLAWLASPTTDVPACATRGAEADRASVARLRACLEVHSVTVRELGLGVTRAAALLAILYRVGLRTHEHLLAAITCARLPIAAAEALSVPTTSFRQYPMRLPEFVYEATPHD